MNIRMKLAVAAALTASLSAFAQIKINDNLSVNGYGVGSYQYFKADKSTSVDSLNVDSALLGATVTFKPVTAVASFYYVPNTTTGLDLPTGHSGVNPNGDDLTLLDAYVTYDCGNGLSATAGKFLSYMGYESFYPIYMDQISYANGDFLAAIPGYHEGVRLDYSDNTQAFGLAGLDSVYSPNGPTRGDGELKRNGGFEAFYSYKGITDLVVWLGYAFDSKGNFEVHSVSTFDVWATYQIDKQARVAAEYQNKDGGTGAKGYNWLAFLDYSFTDQLSAALRVSGEKMDDVGKTQGPGFTKYTICPSYSLTDHLKVRAEYSYYNYTDFGSVKNANFFGIQTIFQF